MATFFAILFSQFIFTVTVAGIISAVGSANMAQYDIEAAAMLLKNIYVKSFGVPEIAAGPVSFLLLVLPAIIAFYTFKTLFGHKK